MNEEIKAEWLEALRSGEYKQASAYLKGETSEGEVGYCCLGVLCEVAVRHGVAEWKDGYHDSEYVWHAPSYRAVDGDESYGSNSTLPLPVAEWAGLGNRDNPSVEYNGIQHALSHLNDSVGLPFPDIAEAIDNSL